MTTLNELLAGATDPDARAALYYVGRYIKQAPRLVIYGKDIFDDERRSAPSDTVKSLAQALIATIEEREGMRATDFEVDRMLTILREISALEKNLGPDVSDDEAKRAAKFFTEFNFSSPET